MTNTNSMILGAAALGFTASGQNNHGLSARKGRDTTKSRSKRRSSTMSKKDSRKIWAN